MSKDMNWKVRVYLATALRALDELGLNEGINNHLSALAPAKEQAHGTVILMLPFGYSWKEATPSKLVGINMDKKLVEAGREGEMPEKTALTIHLNIYKARPDVSSVMHTHMSHATALSCLKDPTVRMIHQNSCRFWNRIAYDKAYGGLVQEMDEGQRIAGLLGSDKNVVLLGHHGVLTAAASIPLAFDLMYFLERACHIQVLAMSTGQELEELPEDVVKFANKQLWKDMDEFGFSFRHLETFQRRYAKENKEFQLNNPMHL